MFLVSLTIIPKNKKKRMPKSEWALGTVGLILLFSFCLAQLLLFI